jgi:hypothetical protein
MTKKYVSRRKFLENLLDRLTSQITLLREPECITPGDCYGALNCSHFYPRARKKTRWSFINCHTQCNKHNVRHNYVTAFYSAWMIEQYPPDVLHKLAEDASVNMYRWSVEELERMVEEYQILYSHLLAETPHTGD